MLLLSCCLALCPLAPWQAFRFFRFIVYIVIEVSFIVVVSNYQSTFGTLSYRYRMILPQCYLTLSTILQIRE